MNTNISVDEFDYGFEITFVDLSENQLPTAIMDIFIEMVKSTKIPDTKIFTSFYIKGNTRDRYLIKRTDKGYLIGPRPYDRDSDDVHSPLATYTYRKNSEGKYIEYVKLDHMYKDPFPLAGLYGLTYCV